eukprot:c13708_g1_i1.p1 GENE.c13708_g1_i1~~c13708_g1_i1.p1  ORF type:complete len:175 (-),score=76.24 c13708_g1_i1:22-546(-)
MPQSLSQHLQNISTSNVPEPSKFFHAVIDSVCGRATDLPANLTVEACKSLVCRTVSVSRSSEEIQKNLISEGIAQDLAPHFSSAIESRVDEIKSHLIRTQFRSCSPSLVNFDWKVQLVLGSDSLSNQQEPLLQLQLQTATSENKAHPASALLEFTSDELDKFIETLENISKQIN